MNRLRQLRPLPQQIIVEALPPEDKTTGGLFLPDIAKEAPQGQKKRPFKARVVGISQAFRKTKNGFGILPEFGVGALVLCTPYSGQKILYGNQTLYSVKETDVLAVLEER